MKTGVTLRNMGPQSSAEIMRSCAMRVEELGFESVWMTDHIAIPPDDAEGSEGRYTDLLTTLAWLAGMTHRVKLGTGVLIVPYRPALPTVKQLATLQELSDHRLLLGLAVGWMDAEFKVLDVDRHQRGKLTDAMLSLVADCFANDVVVQNDQAFIFKPRPPAPPVYIGGGAPHALKRAVKFGHGWLPMARDPERLRRDIKTFDDLAGEAGIERGPVTAMTGLPLHDPDKADKLYAKYLSLGLERLVCGIRYETADEYARQLEALAGIVERASSQ